MATRNFGVDPYLATLEDDYLNREAVERLAYEWPNKIELYRDREGMAWFRTGEYEWVNRFGTKRTTPPSDGPFGNKTHDAIGVTWAAVE